MPRTKISEFSATAADNTDIDSIDIAEGCAPSGINNAIRELMAQLKDFQTGSAGDPFNGAVNGTLGATTPAAATVTSLTDSGNLNFTGTGNRITGDFSNATAANRVMFQTSTVNGGTRISAIANGSGTFSQLALYGGSDLANSSILQLTQFATECSFNSTNSGTGLVSPITFAIAGSEAMRIDTSRNVGIGVTPSAWNASYKTIEIGRVGNAIMGGVAGSSMEMMTNVFLNTGGSYRYANTGAATDYYQNAGNHIWYTAPSGTAGNAISFTQAMTLDASGNLLVGTTSALAAARVVARGVQGGLTSLVCEATGTGIHYQIVFANSNGSVGRVETSGSSTLYATSSDYRLKENVAPMTGALATVAALKPCTYTWKADGSAGQGFIAHELQAVVPDCVTGAKDAVDKDGNPRYQGVDTSFLVATLVAAIQELKAEFDAYKLSHP